MRQTATVVKDGGEIAVVRVDRTSMCDGCHKNGCDGGCSVYSIFGGDKSFTAEAVNRAGAKKGDTVIVETADKNVYVSSFIVFILPIILAFVSYAMIKSFIGEQIAVLSAVGVFAVYFAGLAVAEKVLKNRKKSRLEIVTVISSERTDS